MSQWTLSLSIWNVCCNHFFFHLPHSSFIPPSWAWTSTGSIGSIDDCCQEFYMICQTTHLVFADSSNNKCYFGTASSTNGGSISLTGATWTVYIKEGLFLLSQKFLAIRHKWYFSDFVSSNTGGVFEEFLIPAGELISSQWNKFIYRMYTPSDGDANVHTCKAMCVFDSDNIGTRNGSGIISPNSQLDFSYTST